MTSEDRDYYRRRADEEIANAAKSVSDGAGRAHRAMAERYRKLAGDSPDAGGEGPIEGGAEPHVAQVQSPAG